MTAYFKSCPNCRKNWSSRDELINDETIALIGYHFLRGNVDGGLLLFNHNTEDCGTTLSCKVTGFVDLYQGELCSNRYVRVILQMISKKDQAKQKRVS